MDTDASIGWKNSVQHVLECSSIEVEEPGIVLFDEFQRYRTIDKVRNPIKRTRYEDIWVLLSDGKYAADGKGKKDLLEMVLGEKYDADTGDEDEDEEEDILDSLLGGEGGDDCPVVPRRRFRGRQKKMPSKYKMDLWGAKYLKRKLKLKEPLEEIMTWDKFKKMGVIEDKLKDNSYLEEDNYGKLLIFICGNLDEAYTMASEVEMADIDADVLHEQSKRITIVDIKAALKNRFSYEQIARLGNSHIIYPCLSEKNFRELIARNIDRIDNDLQNTVGVSFSVSQAIIDIVYCNGVFPAQGVRPLFSTISNIVESSIPAFLGKLFKTEENALSLDFEDSCLTSVINGKKVREKIQCVLDDIKKETTNDEKRLVSVHEAGHTVAYALLYGYVPKCIKANLSSSKGGFILRQESSFKTKDEYLKDIVVSLAGGAAENCIFGIDNKTSGSVRDIEKATLSAAAYVRQFMMGSIKGRVNDGREDANVLENVKRTDSEVESLVASGWLKAIKLIQDNIFALKELSEVLFEKGYIEAKDASELLKRFGIEAVAQSDDFIHITPFDKLYADSKGGK
jgi:cell division protease FtsH